MLSLRNTDTRKPAPYPRVERKLSTAKEKGWDKVDGYLLRDKETYGAMADYIPQVGLQENLCACEANLIFICGAATSGKTYGMYLKSLYGMPKNGFTATMFSYREKDSKKGSSISRDAIEVLGNFADCEYTFSDNISFRFPKYNSQLQLANFNYNVANENEWTDFKEDMKKRQSSLIMVDEGTKMQERAMMYLFSRNRDSSGMPPQFIVSFNPEYEHFTREVIQNAGFLDDTWHVIKAMEGKIRYFYMKGKTFRDAVWGDSPQEVVKAANITITQAERDAGLTEESMCKTFTVFTGEAADNRILVNATGGQSVANLSATGEEQAAILRGAYFGPIEQEELKVSRQMIHALFNNPVDGDDTMYATMDISSGGDGNDRMPMIIWRGLRVVAIEVFCGKPMELSDWISTRLRKYGVPVQRFAFDATGHGYWVQGLSSGVPVTANAKVVQEYDEHGNAVTLDEYFNLRSQLLGKTNVMIERGDMSIALDRDTLLPFGRKDEKRKLIDILFDEMNVFVTTKRNKKTYYRSKEEYKAKFKASPDFMECISLRAYFELDARKKKEAAAPIPDDAYDGLYRRYDRGAVRRGMRVAV